MRGLLTSLWRWATRAPMPAAETMPPRPDSLALPTMVAPDWTAKERGDWQTFLASATGQVLGQRILAVEYLALLNAAEKGDAQAMHRAAGYGDLRRYLESLLRAGGEPDTQEPQTAGGTQGDPGIRERFTP